MSESDEPIPTGTELRRAAIARVSSYVCKDRQATHGDAEDNFRQIAAYWALYKGTPFTPGDVAAMMALVKIARMATSPNHLDNWDDLAGYAICGAGIADKHNRIQPPPVSSENLYDRLPSYTKQEKTNNLCQEYTIECANCGEYNKIDVVEQPPSGYSPAMVCKRCNKAVQWKHSAKISGKPTAIVAGDSGDIQIKGPIYIGK